MKRANGIDDGRQFGETGAGDTECGCASGTARKAPSTRLETGTWERDPRRSVVALSKPPNPVTFRFQGTAQ